ncbi:zinc-ribbon domain-containing protein [Streptomyces sp. NPDC050147]|uniref:zinc-ribbon domain-containing protein n=1 Tax=Streptomyces sp. NPDC050147 TaxID=3155513 RepID=UPI0034283009
MASHCPHCGAPTPDEARFCMKCGRERPRDTTVDAGPAELPEAELGVLTSADAAPVKAEADVPAGASSASGGTPEGVDDGTPEGAEDGTPGSKADSTPEGKADSTPEVTPEGPGFTAVSLPAPALPPAPALAAPASPPPPAYVPGAPAAPSPLGAFLGRAFRGDWAGAAQAALWPVGLVLVAAVALAIPSYGQDDGEVVVGFGDRLRIALATLLQAVGGGFEISGSERQRSSLFGGESTSVDVAFDGSATLHLIPLTATALWIGALFIGVRVLRTRVLLRAGGFGGGTAGLEAAVRVTLLVTVGTLVLSLFAQPEIEGVELSSSPVLAALGALVLGLAVSCGVLHRHDLGQWLARRPGWQAAFRATGTALRALAVVLVLCSLVAFISLAQIDDLEGLTDLDDTDVSPLLIALLLLPNLGVAALGLGWGAPLGASVEGSSSSYGGGYESESFGLSELGDVTNDWAVVGALALGLVCALVLGLLAARRSAHRGEQLLAAGIFFGLFLLLAGVGGLSVDATGSASSQFGGGVGGSGSGNGSFETGVSVPDALLFGLLWVFVAALVAPFLLQLAGQRPGAGAAPMPQVPPMPGGPAGAPDASAASGFAAPGTAAPGSLAPGSLADAPTEGAVGIVGPASTGVPTPGLAPTPPASQPAYDPAANIAYAPAAYDPHTFQPHQQPPTSPDSRRTAVWVGTLAAAFLIGSGIAAGVLLWQDNNDGSADKAGGKDDKPAVSGSQDPTPPPPSPSDAPTDGSPTDETPTDEPSASPDTVDAAPELPAGSDLVSDVSGFEFAVPEGWSRQGEERPGQIVYAGSTGPEQFIVGVVPNAPYTSYENFTNIEKDAKKDPKKSDYQRLRLEPNTFQGRGGAIWEYTYTDTAGREIHALNQSYVADNGTEYAILLSWRADFWPAGEGEKNHRIALEHWRLNG